MVAADREDFARDRGGVSQGSLAIAAFSTVVEWYDFTLYLYFITVLARVFFGAGAGASAAALGGFAASYVLRPLGALVFGQIGDRFGRRRMLLLSMALITAAMLATALLPTKAQIGPVAGWLLIGLRCVMAFSVGGEYCGVVAYLLEGAPDGRRGLVVSCAAAASEIGALLAVGVCAATSAWLGGALESWGWRLPFLVGAGLAGAVWLGRSTMEESPEFERQQAAQAVPDAPLRLAWRDHRPAIRRGFAISALGSITYYVGVAYAPAFLVRAGTMDEADALGLSTVAALVVVLVTPLAGALSDFSGRKPVLLGLCVASCLLPVPMFALMTGATAPAGALMLAALGGAVSAVGAVTSAELLPGEGRLSGLALGMTLATAIFGGTTPLLAQLLQEATGWRAIPGAMIAAVALGVFPALATMAETRPRPD